MQSMGCFRGPANEEKEPHLTKIAALSIFACNSSIMAGTIAEDDYKDNNGLEDGLKVRDGLIGRIATEFISRRHSLRKPDQYHQSQGVGASLTFFTAVLPSSHHGKNRRAVLISAEKSLHVLCAPLSSNSVVRAPSSSQWSRYAMCLLPRPPVPCLALVVLPSLFEPPGCRPDSSAPRGPDRPRVKQVV